MDYDDRYDECFDYDTDDCVAAIVWYIDKDTKEVYGVQRNIPVQVMHDTCEFWGSICDGPGYIDTADAENAINEMIEYLEKDGCMVLKCSIDDDTDTLYDIEKVSEFVEKEIAEEELKKLIEQAEVCYE